MAKNGGRTWQPSHEDYWQILDDANPWVEDGQVPPEYAREVERPLARLLWRAATASNPRRFQLILGPRRVGKTTVMYQTVRRLLKAGHDRRDLIWLTMDHPLLLNAQLGVVVKAFLERRQRVVLFIDEISYAPHWDRWLKTMYDEQWPVQVIATSSATSVLKDRRTESGVGRWEEQHLMPYTLVEFLDLIKVDASIPNSRHLADVIRALVADPPDVPGLARYRDLFLLVGGFPELLQSLGGDSQGEEEMTRKFMVSQRVLRSDAVERAIYKDIPQAFGVDSPMALERLLYTLAGEMTGVLKPTKMAPELQISTPTFERYLMHLEQAYLVFTLPNYSGRERNIQKRGRRCYFMDGAVRNAALHRGLRPVRDPQEMGCLMENMAASHLFALSQQTGVRLFYFREDDRHEVDLVYDDPDQPLAFEIASSFKHGRKGLNRLIERYPRFKNASYIVAPGSVAMPATQSGDGIGHLPLDSFLLAVGRQTELAMERRLAG